MSKLNEQTARAMHRTMCRIRYFEEAASAKYKEGVLPGFIHLSIGQEACGNPHDIAQDCFDHQHQSPLS